MKIEEETQLEELKHKHRIIEMEKQYQLELSLIQQRKVLEQAPAPVQQYPQQPIPFQPTTTQQPTMQEQSMQKYGGN